MAANDEPKSSPSQNLQHFRKNKNLKKMQQECVEKFNSNPVKGIRMMQEKGLLTNDIDHEGMEIRKNQPHFSNSIRTFMGFGQKIFFCFIFVRLSKTCVVKCYFTTPYLNKQKIGVYLARGDRFLQTGFTFRGSFLEDFQPPP